MADYANIINQNNMIQKGSKVINELGEVIGVMKKNKFHKGDRVVSDGVVHSVVSMVDDLVKIWDGYGTYLVAEEDLEPYNDPVALNPYEEDNDENKVPKFREILNDMARVYECKNKDYGDSFGKSIDKYGYVSFFVRSHDKIERAKTIISKGRAEVKNEGIMDTLLDNAVYNIMAAMKLYEDILYKKDIKLYIENED